MRDSKRQALKSKFRRERVRFPRAVYGGEVQVLAGEWGVAPSRYCIEVQPEAALTSKFIFRYS